MILSLNYTIKCKLTLIVSFIVIISSMWRVMIDVGSLTVNLMSI